MAGGTLRLSIEDPEPFAPTPVPAGNDVFFPDGQLLARLENADNATITISFDGTRVLGGAEQAALYSVAAEEAVEKPSQIGIWSLNGRRWIVQAFVTPSERVLTAQTFVDGHPLALVFWLPPTGEDPLADSRARSILRDLRIAWTSADPAKKS